MKSDTNPHKYPSDEWFVYNQLQALLGIAKNGLALVYGTLEDYWYDFYPCFAWSTERACIQIRLLMAQPEFVQLEIDFRVRFGVSLTDELLSAMAHRS